MAKRKKVQSKDVQTYTYTEYRKKFLPKKVESEDRRDETAEDPYHVGERLANKSLQQFGEMLVSD